MKAPPSIVHTAPAILRRDAAAAYMGISVSLFEQLVRRKRMPAPRQISDGTTGWLRTELEAHAHALPVSVLPPGPGRQDAPADRPVS